MMQKKCIVVIVEELICDLALLPNKPVCVQWDFALHPMMFAAERTQSLYKVWWTFTIH